MAACILARICRGRLFFRVADALFLAFTQAAPEWVVAEAGRLCISHPIVKLTARSRLALLGGGVAWTP